MPRDFQLGNHSRGTQIVCGLTPSQWVTLHHLALPLQDSGPTTWRGRGQERKGIPGEKLKRRRHQTDGAWGWLSPGSIRWFYSRSCPGRVSARARSPRLQFLFWSVSCGSKVQEIVLCGWPPLCKPMTQKTVVGVMKEAPWLVPQTARGSSEPISQ